MRVNIYAEETTDRVELVKKEIDGREYVGLRFYLYLPVTIVGPDGKPSPPQHVRGPFIHHEGDDDSSAVTFWGKQELRHLLEKAMRLLDEHYKGKE